MHTVEIYNEDTIKNCPYTSIILVPPVAYHRSTFFKIMYVEQGATHILIRARDEEKSSVLRRRISAGDALIVTPRDEHCYELPRDENYIHRDIYVSEERMQQCCAVLSPRLYNEISAGRYPQFFRLSSNTILALAEMLSPLISQCIGDELDAVHRSVTVYLLGCYLAQKHAVHVYPDWLKKLLRDMTQEDFIVQPLAKIVESTNYSHGYVSREFKRYLGKSLKQYINETKLEYSRVLLMSREKFSVEEIALRLEFTTQSNYINLFKRKFGVSPGKFRQTHKDNIETDTYIQWGEKTTQEE